MRKLGGWYCLDSSDNPTEPRDWTIIPTQTAQIARAAFPKGNIYMMMPDELGVLYGDNDFVTLIKARGKARTDSTHVLAAIHQLNRIESVAQTLRHALNQLASVAPEWLSKQVSRDWFDRYSSRLEQSRLPQSKQEQQQLAIAIGSDGHQLLSAIYEQLAPKSLQQLPGVEFLRRVWVQQYYQEAGVVPWRSTDNLPPYKQLIFSPYDPEAGNRTKRDVNWTGYTVHLTETCDSDKPHLITHVETTPAATGDVEMTGIIPQNSGR